MIVLDLSQEISFQTKIFPGYPKPQFTNRAKFDVHGYDSEVMFLSTHAGTHMDAPSHFLQNGKSIDKIAINGFIGKAVIFKVLKGSNELIDLKDIADSQQQIKENDIVIFSTGWEKRIQGEDYLHNPGISQYVS